MITLKAMSQDRKSTKTEIEELFQKDGCFLNYSFIRPGKYTNKSDILKYTKEKTVKIWYGEGYRKFTVINL